MKRTTFSRVAFGSAAVATVIGAITGNETLHRAAKPLLVPALALGMRRFSPVLGVALAAATVGDVLLIDPDDDSKILRGAGAFAVMQGCYCVLLASAGNRPTVTAAVPRVTGWAVASTQLVRKSPEVAPGLAAYGVTLAAMSTLAADPASAAGADVFAGVVVPNSDPRSWQALGGILFTVSDALIVYRRLYLSSTVSRRIVEGAILATYSAAQLLLVEGFNRQ
ncbi:lysoplasmalogenase [Rhodococcus sp. PAMC28707]|uniref:lysoplasmalogenase n=1 Tax=unclassified Rhodococcus (in: high G+C Gram-positive bacteria) TaxID=192944 RepID=UPI00109DCAD8|nr:MULTISPECIES: lysoplasmalogenase [unclassified Rhodococcus (in: high G+C Gram-positive bacteria)]QCB49052.1 lysoplasmalogenase [Rhodococcus sp. PAMC28705]QCB59260.1 lysoplasmalogenase [Rhodococcus sp. PAMC28707]